MTDNGANIVKAYRLLLLQTKYNEQPDDIDEDELNYGDDPSLYIDEDDDFNQEYDDTDCEKIALEICHTTDGKHSFLFRFLSFDSKS